jgi:hypothetical protein
MEEKEFAVMAEVFDKSQKRNLMLVTIYGPAQEERREQFLIDLSSICANIEIPTLIVRDFNILRYSKEKNKNFNNNRFSEMFNWVINSYEPRDVSLSGGLFTWSNNQDNPTLERLDRVLISPEWETKRIPSLPSKFIPIPSLPSKLTH